MRNYLILFMVFSTMSLALMGQEIPKKTIKVQGKSIYVDPSPIYNTIISISGVNTSFNYDAMNLNQMVVAFKKAILEEGLNWNDFKENPNFFGFETMSYGQKGVIYEYQSSSAENMKKILSLKSMGLQRLHTVAEIMIDPEEAVTLNEMALSNAKVKAKAIATAMGKNLGEIISIEDHGNNINLPHENSLYYDRPAAEYTYYVNVIYELK